jgi:hypothetical protein
MTQSTLEGYIKNVQNIVNYKNITDNDYRVLFSKSILLKVILVSFGYIDIVENS